MVRRTCASIIPALSTQVEQPSRLLELWSALVRDKVDSVKVRAVEGTPQMMRLLSKPQIEEHIKGYFALAAKSEKSWRVRYTVPELFPQVAKYLGKRVMLHPHTPQTRKS